MSQKSGHIKALLANQPIKFKILMLPRIFNSFLLLAFQFFTFHLNILPWYFIAKVHLSAYLQLFMFLFFCL